SSPSSTPSARPTEDTRMRRMDRALLALGFVACGGNAASAVRAQAPAKPASAGQDQAITAALNDAYTKFKTLKEGKNADYIPALAKVDPNIFAIALVTTDGKVYTAGDIKSEVSIQSISKVFTMAKVMEE